MTSARSRLRAIGSYDRESDAIALCRAPRDLARIRDTGVQLAILKRAPPPALASWLDGLAPAALPHFRILVARADARRAVEASVLSGAHAGAVPAMMLARDMDDLVQVFGQIARCDDVDIRLERIAGDACWKFHRDHVPVRLLTTYRGPGSEWVAPHDAEQAIAAQQDYRGALHRLPRHAIGLFKGCADDACTGIVHRSPPIAGSGRTRLLLCLNVPTAASPARWNG